MKMFCNLVDAFAVAHINYGKIPMFNEFEGKAIAENQESIVYHLQTA